MNRLTGKITRKRIDILKRRANRRILWPLIRSFYIDYHPDYKNSILLAGTEKSGTTWISDVINYKREYRYVFEPFWPDKVDLCKNFKPRQYLRPDNRDRYYIETAQIILSGKIRNKWTDKYHRRFIADKRLVKDIRANLFLKWIHNHFPNMPIILLLRHPCAVVRSHLRRTDPEPDLDKFLAQPELVEDFLHPFEKEIKAAQTTFDQLVFRWCIETYVPLKQFSRNKIHLAFYERFCEMPKSEIDEMFSFLGKNYDQTIFAGLRKPSPVSREESAIISGGNLVDNWRKQITDEQIQRAVEILSLFGLDKIYSYESMPDVDSAYEIMEGNVLH
jgi:hypothetical protein